MIYPFNMTKTWIKEILGFTKIALFWIIYQFSF